MGNRESHSSSVPIASLSPEGKHRGLKNVITQKKKQQKTIKRLELKLEKTKERWLLLTEFKLWCRIHHHPFGVFFFRDIISPSKLCALAPF